MTNLRVFSIVPLIALVLATNASPALAATPRGACEAEGGSWVGVDSNNGTCTYEEGLDIVEQKCGTFYAIFTEEFTAGVSTDSNCKYTRGFGGSGSTSENKDASKAITLSLGGGKNGKVTFSPGACVRQCTITATLPTNAKNALPSGVHAKLYVRLAGGSGSYLVCFKNPKGEPAIIYKFVGGTWAALVRSSASTICASSSGSGAYYLGAN